MEATEYGQQEGSEFRYQRKLTVGGPRHLRLALLTDQPVYRPGTTVSIRAWLVSSNGGEQGGGPVQHMAAWLLGPGGLVMASWPRRPLQSGGRPGSLDYRLAVRAPRGQWMLRAQLGPQVEF